MIQTLKSKWGQGLLIGTIIAMGLALPTLAKPSDGKSENPKVQMTVHIYNQHNDFEEVSIVMELFPKKAPKTVKNFLNYVNSGFYNGTIFHRVIDGFMAQGGGFQPGLIRKKVKSSIKNEGNNGLSNTTGTIAMARTSDPHSATAQFFINLVPNTYLDYVASTPRGYGYTVFGQVESGMSHINKIKKVKTRTDQGFANVPVYNVVIVETKLLKTDSEEEAITTQQKSVIITDAIPTYASDIVETPYDGDNKDSENKLE
jgi:peptidyl-prolyl cis-trans isomerase B (cyclophilin B)